MSEQRTIDTCLFAGERFRATVGKAIVSKAEMVDRIKTAVDARTDSNFTIMARTDALDR